MNDIVSVIIPCYQQGRFLSEAVSSLQSQSHTNWEAIIVNDGSTDDTELIAQALCVNDPRVHYISKPNGGPSSARNAGLRHSTGEYIQFLDADDRLDSRKFELHSNYLCERPEVGIVYGNAMYFTDGAFGEFRCGWRTDGPDKNWIAANWIELAPFLNKLLKMNILPVCSPVIRRTVINKIGFFNEEIVACEDWEYWLRCAVAGVKFQFYDVDGTDAFIRTHKASAMTNRQRMLSGEYLTRMMIHEILPTSELRRINLAGMLYFSHSMEQEGRAERYSSMSLACRSLRERIIVYISSLCDNGGLLEPFSRGLCQWLPRRIQCKLTAMGFGFAK